MTIKEAEQKTGLTRSNIRFYEKEKLIEPIKKNGNGYRDYSQEDIDRIKKIAYLRTLGISVDDILSIISQEISLYEVIKKQSVKLEAQIAELTDSKLMCEKMLKADTLDFENLNIEEYLLLDMNDYWKENKKVLRFDSVGFLYKWGSVVTWMILFFLCIVIAILVYPKLPSKIPVQWDEGIATSWVNKYFIFIYPAACVIIRFVLRPILYDKLQKYTLYFELLTEYLSNSMCMVVLSVEVFSVLFVVELVKNIVVILVAEAIILAGLLFMGVWRMIQ